MKNVHCPQCMSRDITFINEVCTEDGKICGDHMQCNHCGKQFTLAYDTRDMRDMLSGNRGPGQTKA